LSKNCSTDAAVFVPKPKSKSSAPKDTKPSGTFNTPDNTPDIAASIFPTSLLPSAFEGANVYHRI
jgi:hypothetical protein